jgi:exodeoxyribonuclease VII small subunit
MFRRANSSDVNLRTLGGACTVRTMATRTPKEAPKLDFETAMRELEELVERLEQGELPLEESLAVFERGVMLTRTCQTALKDAEQKVEILLKKAGEPAVEDFEADESDVNPAQLFE